MSRQVLVTAFGGPETLAVVERPEPHAGPGQVRVRVTAAGLNPVDWKIAEGGATAERFGVTPPFGNGNDFAGVVDEVGDGVTAWSPGDRVYGGARFQAQADHLVVGDLTTLNRTPDTLADEVAAVLDIAGRTAVAGVDALALGPDDVLLVTAAAGGVGVLAVQLAVRTGATVLGTASAANHETLRRWGATPIAYGAGLPDRIRAAAPGGVTAVLDCHGRESIDLALELGIPAARINSVADKGYAESVGAISIGRATTPTSAIRPLAELVGHGAVEVPIEARYPLSDVQAAYERLREGHLLGKIVLTLE